MRRLLLGVLIVGTSLTLAAQSPSDNRPITIDELYLSREIEIQILASQARAADRESKLDALDTIESLIEEGSVGEDNDQFMFVLEQLATEGTSRTVLEGGAVVNNFPDVRWRAAELLGEVGGERSRNILVGLLADEPEPTVQSAAIYSLGQIGMLDRNVIGRITQVLRRNNAAVNPDNNLAFAILLAIEDLAEANSGLNAEDGTTSVDLILSIVEMQQANYIRQVRDKAREVLQTLRQF